MPDLRKKNRTVGIKLKSYDMNIFSLVFRGKLNAGKDLDAFSFSRLPLLPEVLSPYRGRSGKCRKAGLFASETVPKESVFRQNRWNVHEDQPVS